MERFDTVERNLTNSSVPVFPSLPIASPLLTSEPPTLVASSENVQRRISVLGATGSIGEATLDVVESLSQSAPIAACWQLASMSGHRRVASLAGLAMRHLEGLPSDTDPPTLVFSDASLADQARHAIASNDKLKRWQLDFGPDALVRAATDPRSDTLVAGIVGSAGLESTLAAVEAGKRVALANKETLVVAGPVVMGAARRSGAEILPIDSEHSAIFQCLAESRSLAGSRVTTTENIPVPVAHRWPGVKRIILTASGGPFRDASHAEMQNATRAQALNHPTWQMGEKITIDSATMMNKALEIIEAKWLFGIDADKIDVVIHPQSLIHSMVEYDDGSVVAQVSPPDMRLPIQYSLTYPRRCEGPANTLDLSQVVEMSLFPADLDRFPALRLGFDVARAGGTAGAVLNGANEAAVALFLDEKIRFTDIAEICRRTLSDHNFEPQPSLSRLLELDRWSRKQAIEHATQIAS